MKGYYREPKTRVTPNKKQHQSGPTMDPAIFVRYTITSLYSMSLCRTRSYFIMIMNLIFF